MLSSKVLVDGGMGWFPREALELQTGKPEAFVRAFYSKLERRIVLMILLLVNSGRCSAGLRR